MHRFEAEKAEELISEKRKRIQPIEPFEGVIGSIEDKNTAVDFGAGIGYFTVPLSKHFKRVFAIEAQEEMAEKLRKRLKMLGVENVGIIISDKPIDFDFEVSLILFANVLHEVENWRDLLEWSRIAKHVIVIDWKKVRTDFGPPLEERIGEEEMKKVLSEIFKSVKKFDFYKYHYFFLCSNE